MRRALITGLAGTELSTDEARFLRTEKPCGIILFARNVQSPSQVLELADSARNEVGDADLLVLVDQEGGRVQRLLPPDWRRLPAAERYGALPGSSATQRVAAARAIAHLTAQDLQACGINTNCAPCADLRIEGADAIIGDRAYGAEPDSVTALARATAEGYIDGGVLPVVKHIPGHGRADVDSHLALPLVRETLATLEATDFATFRALSDLPAAMTAHVVYAAIDAERPATISRRVIDAVVRGSIGFDGLLMTDDLSMKALSGSLEERTEASLGAGCDVVLHCNGELAEMQSVAGVTPALSGRAQDRYARAWAVAAATPPPLRPEYLHAAKNWLMQLVPSSDSLETG